MRLTGTLADPLSQMEATALALAHRAHAGQVDRSNEPIFLHSVRVMMRLLTEEERTVALLHDVVEDTAVTLVDLLSHGFPTVVVDAVDAITRRKHEPYSWYILRVKRNALATTVKLADLADNMSEDRAANLPTELLTSGWRAHKLAQYTAAVLTLEAE